MSRRATAAAVTAVVLLVGVGVLIGLSLGGDGNDGDSATPTTTGPGGPGAAASAPSPQGSGGVAASPAPAGTKPPPTIGPLDVTFVDYVGGLRLPVSPTAGPADIGGNLASGFARSPMGAVMAGAHISTRTAGVLGEPVWRPTIERQVVGPYKDALLQNALLHGRPGVPKPGDRVAGSDSRLLGWQWDSYSDDVAVVRHLMSQLDGARTLYLATRVETRWIDGDWRLVAPVQGSWTKASEFVTGTAGFNLYGRA
jgi:hypothetical protein